MNVHESNWRLSLSKHSCSSVNLCTKRKKRLDFRSRDTPPGSSFQNSQRRLFWDLKCASVERWLIGQSVSSDFSLYSLFIYLFSKLMTHTYVFIFQKRFSRSRTYSHLLFKKECSVKGSLLPFHFFYLLYLILKAQFVQLLL